LYNISNYYYYYGSTFFILLDLGLFSDFLILCTVVGTPLDGGSARREAATYTQENRINTYTYMNYCYYYYNYYYYYYYYYYYCDSTAFLLLGLGFSSVS
jgi:hypothetical protein